MKPAAPAKDQSKTFAVEANAIRLAWRSGKRLVNLNGRSFKIHKEVRKVTYQTGNSHSKEARAVVQQHKATEEWLIARPADGSLVPIYSVESVAGGNFRSNQT